MVGKITLFNAFMSAVSAGTIIWDGRFNETSSADLEKWSFSNPVGSYQYYIHGTGAVTDYVNVDSTYKNPADTGSKQGVKITIDETAKWNGQSMLRTELIPQTSAAINKGKVFYHFSIKTSTDNVPLSTNEHQIAFFESHFTELKYGGQGDNPTHLHWYVSGASKWDVELVADEWHNIAYEIDFDAGSVSLWHSTGSDALTSTAGPVTTSTSSNGADWHLGVLRLPGSNDGTGAEDWYFSGVYVESGDLTTSVNSAGGSVDTAEPGTSSVVVAPSSTAVAPSSTAVTPSSTAVAISTTAAAVVETPVPSSTAAAVVETPVPSSTAAAVETPVTSAIPIATSAPIASSTFVTSIKPATSSTPVAAPVATPTASAGAGSNALPGTFTLNEFISWLQGVN
ncbi:glycoside hydrolase family 131 protein [Pleomassaria siparia CBS 279.74]|uniref:Glycoside hydrolase family 131 protein n=1 Tax=Pleomassaria siparia CBS 279.74 TaxID=1314801 RepID=A0A6G1JSM4_9PLEO|nr:glycoside hydrolase family 131 protein [Pleomassaria siparia CBS 279.74]